MERRHDSGKAYHTNWKYLEIPADVSVLDKIYSTEDSTSAISNGLIRISDGKKFKERMSQIIQIIDADLTGKQKTVITEYFLEEKTQGEIARKMGVTQCGVSRHLARAINKIRKNLGIKPGTKGKHNEE